MDATLYDFLVDAGVREDTIDILIREELITLDLLKSTTDELIRSCNIKAGQIVMIRKGVDAMQNKGDVEVILVQNTSLDNLIFHVKEESTEESTEECSSASNIILDTSIDTSFEDSSPHKLVMVIPQPAFKNEEHRCNERWIQNFQLPKQFSPQVTEGLREKYLSGVSRNEFIRDVCSAIRIHTMNPTKRARDHVAISIIKEYPFLADKLGCGTASWEQSIKNRFKNLRKNKRVHVAGNSNNANSAAQGEKPSTSKSQRIAKLELLEKMTEGETEETCKEHITVMKKEMGKTANKNVAMIRELMDLTYPSRRREILTNATSIKDSIAKYPALQLVAELKAEFDRITSEKSITRKMVDKFKSELQSKIINLAHRRNSANNNSYINMLMQDMVDAIEEEQHRKSEIEENVAVMLLQFFLKDRTKSKDALIKICPEEESIDQLIKKTVEPMLIGGGCCGRITPLYIVAEGTIILSLTSMGLAGSLALLVAIFYVFNIEYPKSGKNVFEFIEAALLDNTQQARKRVLINKFLQDLEQ